MRDLLAVVLGITLFAVPTAYASNAIQIENAMAGTTNWSLKNPAVNREIEGYASMTSVGIGGTIDFAVSTADSTFNIEIFRMGWYGGLGARLLATVPNLPGQRQPTPPPDPTTGMVECHWSPSYSLSIPPTWTSGIFLARLTGNQSGKQSYIIFVVRDDARTSDILFESAVTTFQAYNFWPGGPTGKSLYDWAPGGRAWKVSFNRPYVLGRSYSPTAPGTGTGLGAGEFLTNLQPGPEQGYPIPAAGFEYNMLRWLERNGYDVTYFSDIDHHANPALLSNHRAYLSVGHNEYWSMEMRESLVSALANGLSLGFFSANTLYWRVRFESSWDGNPDRTMVSYKYDAPAHDPLYNTNPQLATVRFRDPRLNLPEAALVGVEYFADPIQADIVVSNASHWLFNGTGLTNGSRLAGMLGYEADLVVPGVSPPGIQVLANSPTGQLADDNPVGMSCDVTPCNSHVTWYSAGRGFVFATGSIQWSWGLDDYNAPALRPLYSSIAAQKLTSNVLAAMITPVTVSSTSLPNGTRGVAYPPFQMTASGGGQPYNWTATGLPAGMTLISNGILSGTPTASGTSAVVFTVTDAAAHVGTRSLSLIVDEPATASVARVVSVDFVGNASPMALTETAGVVPRANWNTASGNVQTSPLPLVDEAGVSGGATITWSSDNTWSLPISVAPGNLRMMAGYLDNASGHPTTIAVSNLPPSPTGYDLYVYTDGDNGGGVVTRALSLSAVGVQTGSIQATDPANTNFSGTFQNAINSNGNYVKFSGITATALTLTATSVSSTSGVRRATVNGLQIVPSPQSTPPPLPPPAAKAISIDFVGNSVAMDGAEFAGVVPKGNWNRALGFRSTVSLPLVDETGMMTSASVNWSSGNSWALPIGASAGNARMMAGYLDNGNGSPISVTVSGLPDSANGYDVYVYADGDNATITRTATYDLTAAGFPPASIRATDVANTNFNGSFAHAAGSNGNYVQFTAMKATAFTLTATPFSTSSGGLRSPVNGLQIIPR